MNRENLFKTFIEDKLTYSNLIDSASEGIIITDAKGAIILVNRRAGEMFGYSQNELIGKSLEILIPQRFRNHHESHRTNYLKAPSRRSMGIGRDLVGLRKDKSEFPIEASLSPIKTDEGVFVLSFIIDITLRKETEKALEREKIRIQEYLDIAGVILMVINKDETIEMINKRGCAIVGYDEKELIGQNWFDKCIPENKRDFIRNHYRKILTDNRAANESFDHLIETRSGEERIISWRNVLLRDDIQEVTGILCSGEDITEQVKAQRQAKLHQQQLAQADKMATLGILVSGVAHEINNPTSFIMLNGKIFSKVWSDIAPILESHYENEGDFVIAGMPFSRAYEKISRLIDGVSEGAKRIERIIRSLKDFARQDSGELNESVNINEIIESAIIIVHNLIKKTTDDFAFIPGEQLPQIRGNSQQLEQVIINLLTNACQSLTENQQKLNITTNFHPKDSIVSICVRDEGTGISQENLAHITDPFFTTKQSSGGTGLGLSICYNIVKTHGGTLNFQSELNKGTVVTVKLPVHPGEKTGEMIDTDASTSAENS